MKYLKGFLVLITLAAVATNVYWMRRMYKFNEASSEYFKYLKLKTDCLQAQNGMNQSDIFLAAQGRTRKDVKGIARQFLPERRAYDVQNKECKEYAEYLCWHMDLKNPASVDRCWKRYMTEEEYEEFKKSGKNPWEQRKEKNK